MPAPLYVCEPTASVSRTTAAPPTATRTQGLGRRLCILRSAKCTLWQNRLATSPHSAARPATRSSISAVRSGAATANRVGATPIRIETPKATSEATRHGMKSAW